MSQACSLYPPFPLANELGASPVSDSQRAWLNRQGIGNANIERDWRGRPVPIMQANVSLSTDGLWFDPDPQGQPAFIVPEVDRFNEVIDFIAWGPKANSATTYVGILPLCGSGNLLRPRVSEGLLVHATFASWLAAGRSGAFIRDVERSVELLRDAGPLIFESEEQALAVFNASSLKTISIQRVRRVA
jgi:hypothetical protein